MERRSFIMNIGFGLAGSLIARQVSGSVNINPANSNMTTMSPLVNKFMMLSLNVSDMPKAKAFYTEKLGLKISTEYRMDDNNWWVSLTFPNGGATFTLARTSTYPESTRPSTLALYFSTADINAAGKELKSRGVKSGEIQDDLFGPGSGVKFIKLEDPDGNMIHVVQAHEARAPF